MSPERYLRIGQPVDFDTLIDRMHQMSPFEGPTTFLTELALKSSWAQLSLLMQSGGAINLHGQVLKIGMENLEMPAEYTQELEQTKLMGFNSDDFHQLTFLDPEIGNMPKNNAIWVLARNFSSQLAYRVNKKDRIEPLLVMMDGTVATPKYIMWLKLAFQKNVMMHHKDLRAPQIIIPSTVVRQLLVHTAEQSGKKRLRRITAGEVLYVEDE